MVKIQTERQSCLPNLLHTKCKESEAGEHPKLHVMCLYCRTLNWVYKKRKKNQLAFITLHCSHIKLFLNQKQGPDFFELILPVLDL